MPSGKVPVYCHMTSDGLGACGGGGWTLVMKTDGNKVSHRTTNRLSLWRNRHINIMKAPVSQLVIAEVNSDNCKAVLASNYTLQLRIRGCNAAMKCDLKGIKHYSHSRCLVVPGFEI